MLKKINKIKGKSQGKKKELCHTNSTGIIKCSKHKVISVMRSHQETQNPYSFKFCFFISLLSQLPNLLMPQSQFGMSM